MSSVALALMRRTKYTDQMDQPAPQGRASSGLESIADSEWEALSERAAILRSAGDGPLSRKAAKRLANRLEVHPSTVYRWRSQLEATGLLTALSDSRRGFPNGTSRLAGYQEHVLQKVIAKHIRRSALVRIVDLVEDVLRACSAEKISPPSRRTITRRWQKALVAHNADCRFPLEISVMAIKNVSAIPPVRH